MKTLSLYKANQLRAGQTIYWVEAYVHPDDVTKLVVVAKEKLLVGKKRMLPATGLFFPLQKPAVASFVTKDAAGNRKSFHIPSETEDGYGACYLFANRRSAQTAAAQILEGHHPELVESLFDQAKMFAKLRMESKLRDIARAEWEKAHPEEAARQRHPIRAIGESEVSGYLGLHYPIDPPYDRERFKSLVEESLSADSPVNKPSYGMSSGTEALVTWVLKTQSDK